MTQLCAVRIVLRIRTSLHRLQIAAASKSDGGIGDRGATVVFPSASDIVDRCPVKALPGRATGSGHGRFGGKAAIAEFMRWITVADSAQHYPF